jgi:hypothetical protein
VRNSKIIDLLSSFSPTEVKHFKSFLESPYFNKKSGLLPFYDYIIAHYPDFESEQLEKENVFEALFKEEVFEDKKIRYMMSDLAKLVERFLTIQFYEKDKERVNLDLLTCYLERDQDKHYLILKSKVEKDLTEVLEEESEIHLKRMRFADLEELHFEQQRKRRFDENIQIASNELDRYYFIKKLKYSCGMQDRQQFLSAAYQDNLTDEFLSFVEENAFLGSSVIKSYYAILLALKKDLDDKYFYQLKNILKDEADHIPNKELKEIYFYAINFCARKIRLGQDKFLSEALELYQKGIEQQILVQKGVLSPWTFTNVVKLALRLKQYDWIEQFIRRNGKKLPENFRQNAMNYNLAELFYYRKSFSEALDHLNRVKFSDLNYYLGSRVMLIKIYFEQEEEQALLSQLAAFTMFLKRNKEISIHLKRTYLNFCNLLFSILKRNPKKLPQLEEKIERTSPLTDKVWLLQQLKKV